jgi:hypothetical protein
MANDFCAGTKGDWLILPPLIYLPPLPSVYSRCGVRLQASELKKRRAYMYPSGLPVAGVREIPKNFQRNSGKSFSLNPQRGLNE